MSNKIKDQMSYMEAADIINDISKRAMVFGGEKNSVITALVKAHEALCICDSVQRDIDGGLVNIKGDADAERD